MATTSGTIQIKENYSGSRNEPYHEQIYKGGINAEYRISFYGGKIIMKNWKVFLNILGYEKREYKYLDYNAPEDAPQDLFKEE